MKKFLSLALSAVVLVGGLTSCAKESPAALTYGETVVTEAMYTYYVSTYKGRYIQTFSDISDTEEFWNSDIGGKTGEEMIEELIYQNVIQNLVAAEEYRKAGLKLSSSEESDIDTYIDSMIEELAGGSRQTLNGNLAEFGVNLDMLREMFRMERRAYLYREYLYGEGGPEAIDDGDRDEYFKNNFVRFRQIFINNINAYEKDKDGYPIQDENGNPKIRDLTDEEKAAADKKISDVRSALEAGEDFEKLQEKYCAKEDRREYYFSPATSTSYLTSVVSAAFELKEGEWTYVEAAAEKGAFFIQRIPLADKAYKDEKLTDFFSTFEEDLMTELYDAKLEGLAGDIVKNEKFLDSVSVKDAPANYYYY